ncbi:hypothetical protein [Oscillatoria sp. FACHB-1406]|uniref:hypothetical protein n=1 Tax=Oscillatoria sp. FACHB-1406 TaxID=2692846 RepID=UPI001686D414|nr:hypothetical protein [Oscillatoria sp. FACHB-1406]MBD2579921.1 hypothetical protein [Oscillatoria sp. FACHB-1406]
MKFTRCLSVIAVVSCLSANSVAAIAKTPESENSSTSAAKTEPIFVAGFFDSLQQTIQTIQQVGGIIQQHNQQQELEEARRRASEQERLEAERRQRYFESLSPQEQKAYMEEQRALQAQRDTAALLFMMTLFSAVSSDEPAPASSQYDYDVECKTVDGLTRCD